MHNNLNCCLVSSRKRAKLDKNPTQMMICHGKWRIWLKFPQLAPKCSCVQPPKKPNSCSLGGPGSSSNPELAHKEKSPAHARLSCVCFAAEMLISPQQSRGCSPWGTLRRSRRSRCKRPRSQRRQRRQQSPERPAGRRQRRYRSRCTRRSQVRDGA